MTSLWRSPKIFSYMVKKGLVRLFMAPLVTGGLFEQTSLQCDVRIVGGWVIFNSRNKILGWKYYTGIFSSPIQPSYIPPFVLASNRWHISRHRKTSSLTVLDKNKGEELSCLENIVERCSLNFRENTIRAMLLFFTLLVNSW